ncbi:MAG: hypothetical protein A2V93_07875 [Ignavibacteria bacterium RBG_16_34_14]|nr:MAG: hypothetical protein A2V93_07875 [Ignavibacteria bacterium RBG_16_34_14]
MQAIFVILAAISIAFIAKKRKRNLWGWGLIGAVSFTVIDTIISLLLLAIFFETLRSDQSWAFLFISEKFVLLILFVAVFNAKLKPLALLDGTKFISANLLETYIEDNNSLPEFILCPKCNAELQLDQEERNQCKFQCSECNEFLDLSGKKQICL